MDWGTDTIPEGRRYLLRAYCADNLGGEAYSEKKDLTIDHTPPVAFFRTPAEEETVTVTLLTDTLHINGVVADSNLGWDSDSLNNEWGYRLFYGLGRNPAEWIRLPVFPDIRQSVFDGILYDWGIGAFDSGDYSLKLLALDLARHQTTAFVHFYLKNTNPKPRVSIDSPPTDSYLRGDTTIIGSAQDSDLSKWVLRFGRGNPPTWTGVVNSGFQNIRGPLGRWDTRSQNDGRYLLSLLGVDLIGRTDSTQISATVDNTPPVDSIAYPPDTGCVCRSTSIIGSSTDLNFKG